MTLDEAQREIESKFTLGPEGNHQFSATGEEYAEIVSGGRLEEYKYPCYCTSIEAAVRLWKEAVEKYTSERTGTLYWRVKPEIDLTFIFIPVDEKGEYNGHPEFRDSAVRPTWRVYSRLLVSDKPQICDAWIERETA